MRSRIAAVAAAIVLFFGVLSVASPAQADDSTCQTATNGYVCTYVANNGTWIDHIFAIRGKATPAFDICRSSAWAYFIPPTGGAYGLGYVERHDCLYGRAAGRMDVKRHVPSGSRVCTKFMEFDAPVGGEPCTIVQ